MQCASYRNPNPALPTWCPGGFERTRKFGCLERSGSRGSPRAQPAREDRATARRGLARCGGLAVGDRPQLRENVRVCHAQIEGAGELAVEVIALGVDVVVARSTAVVPLSFHVRRSTRLSRVQQRVRRRSCGEDAALEKCERKYPRSARIPHGRRCQHHGNVVIPLKRNGSPKRTARRQRRSSQRLVRWEMRLTERPGSDQTRA